MINDKEFLQFKDGPFRDYFEKFIEYKRGKGEKVSRSTIINLRSLNNKLCQYSTVKITAQMVEEILSPESFASSDTRGKSISLLRQFCQFMGILGIPCAAVGRNYAALPRPQFRPYIFSTEEISKLLHVADHLTESRRCNNHLRVYPIMLRILIGTGMRIGEVLQMTNDDVDILRGVIKVINGKNGVSRFIPVSDSLMDVLRIYFRNNDSMSAEEPFFVSPYTGSYYSYSAAKYMFQKICAIADIRCEDSSLPTLHSLRHTFCTRSLEQMIASGMSEYSAVPILAAYMGHVNLVDTEKYIHFTEIAHARFISDEMFMADIVPEVSYDE
ncbi:MAG: tyrosine-type recombinase/integrase [Acetobacterium sp.]|jgi:integrase|uniref:Tyrosine-type recombinase/integrase n=1 Tax=Acetobacterium malicum TaxID=52692 RepID=A0ABR6Z2F5_9FIRM|nr:tyrosine-type recombinase/integrase [Acetobacterium malicum]MBC3901691.1 tyrosine-type recombinase/integrase [Acetobacterium malicum]MBU4438680.1 tyrosine-type recombinase/integrase [Bacillota bacterium]MCG2731399.1 tyrosine-type recombinase/integrase [Acetobacterium sp.]